MAIEQLLVDTFDLQAIYFDIRNRMASLYQKPATGIPASDLAEGVIPDISGKADKTDTVLLSTLSRGRMNNSTVGDGSIAFGDGIIASGPQSQAFGVGTLASGMVAHTEGYGTEASGYASHAEGYSTEASGYASHAEGFSGLVSGACAHKEGSSNTVTSSNGHAEGSSNVVGGINAHSEGNGNIVTGANAHVEGSGNTAKANSSHVGGMFSVADSYLTWEEWTADTLYEVGRKVKIGVSENNEIVYYGYICKTQNQDHEFDSSKWDLDYKMNFARIIGNGADYNHRSNALALGWDGNLYLMGDVYVGCDADSTDGTKLVKMTDYANSNNYGIIKLGNGLSYNAVTGATNVNFAAESFIKLGGSSSKVISPSRQHIAAYYGLSKLAGVDLADETVTVGTYPDPSKQAIQKLFGLDGIFGDYESATASKAYAIGETFIYNGKRYRATAAIALGDVIAPGTNCELDPLDGRYIKDTDYASTSRAGLIKVDGRYGLAMRDSPDQDTIKIYPAGENDLKVGTNYYRPVVPYFQHQSVFYGLSKLAGVDLASETVTVGTYPENSKAAILEMLGAVKDVQIDGTTILNSGVANVPIATGSTLGVGKFSGNDYGIGITASGFVYGVPPTEAQIKAGTNAYKPITASRQHLSVFYALAKIAGADLANVQDVTAGVYPEAQKTAIQSMLGIEANIPLVETVTGATVSITGMPNVRYICETAISELTITPPASGSIVVRFTAGSGCIVVLPQTVKLPEWFDISSLEAGTTYEIIITDGVYGGVMSWAA